MAGPAIGQIVAVDRGDDDVLQPHFSHGIGNILRFLRVDLARHARLHVAKGAGAGADIAQDHHGRVLFGPALTNIWAGGLFAHGGQRQPAHQRLGFGKAGRGWSLDADPVRLADPLDGRRSCHGAAFTPVAQACQPPRSC